MDDFVAWRNFYNSRMCERLEFYKHGYGYKDGLDPSPFLTAITAISKFGFIKELKRQLKGSGSFVSEYQQVECFLHFGKGFNWSVRVYENGYVSGASPDDVLQSPCGGREAAIDMVERAYPCPCIIYCQN